MKPANLLLLCCLFFIACEKDKTTEQGNVKIIFNSVVNGQPLVLNTGNYTNAAGEAFTVSAFKYYLSNFSLIKQDNSSVPVPDTYFLVDAATPASGSINLTVPKGQYKAIAFYIGVDSVRNVSGAQTGALDPLQGMFWSWNSGYIMAKMEGTSPVSTAANHALTYHIGGFKGQYNAVKRIEMVSPTSLTTGKDRQTAITIAADLYTWFSNPNPVKFSDNATIHVPGELSAKISSNYVNMFRITNVADL